MNRTLKNLALLFVGVLAFYVIAYSFIEHRRTRQGPWRVTFTNSISGAPAMVINEPVLAITNIQIVFSHTEVPQDFQSKTVSFDQPRPVPFPLPFGECVFMDTTFQPGTVVLRFADHEVQLLPRVLTIDHREYAWTSGQVIELTSAATNTPLSK
jgi:hypothetical protein